MASKKTAASTASATPATAPSAPATSAPAGPMSFDRFQRWRLILGKRVEDQMAAARAGAGACGRGESTLSGGMGEMDAALGAIYDPPEENAQRSAGLGKGQIRVAAWLSDVRKYFDHDVVAVIQQDAIEKKGWKQLLFEPEALEQVTPSVEMVGTLMSLRGMIPEKAKDAAREIVRRVVEEIKKKMQAELERAVRGALDRSRHQPIPSLPNMDWKRTISANLKNYIPERHTLIPDHFFFYSRQQRRKEWNVIVCMDQSGSMADSVVYGSVMGCILASMPALETHVVVFDTEVVDLTPVLSDPVEVIFGVQLGGGTDIHRAVKYCQQFVTNPQKTLFILMTDLIEGGDQSGLVQRLGDMASGGVRAMVLLAMNDSGVPCYDENLAKRISNVGVPCFACTPGVLPNMLEAVLKGRDLKTVADQYDTRKREKLACCKIQRVFAHRRRSKQTCSSIGGVVRRKQAFLLRPGSVHTFLLIDLTAAVQVFLQIAPHRRLKFVILVGECAALSSAHMLVTARRQKYLAVSVVLVGLLIAYQMGILQRLASPAELKQSLVELGPRGYVAFVVAYALLQPFGAPGTVFVLAAPLIWPWPIAYALSMTGTMAASVIGFSFSRFIARDWVTSKVPPKYTKYNDWLNQRAFLTVALMRAVFWMPQWLHGFLGVSKVSFSTHFWGSLVGYALPLLLVSYFGQQLFDTIKNAPPMVWVTLVGVLLLGVLIWAMTKRIRNAKVSQKNG